jgi:nitrogen fixation NifU-like protein
MEELYREQILEHYKRPHNWGHLDSPEMEAEDNNPLCGDQLTVYAAVDGDRVTDIRFEGSGCAISVASASLMSEAVKGKTRAEIATLFDTVHTLLTHSEAPVPASLGKLAALSGVREFPARVKCASLCWHTLNSALAGTSDAVTTE